MLFLNNIDIGYKSSLLENLSLNLENFSMTFLIGSNGLGKTTLLKTLAGILPPLKGSLECDSFIAYVAQIPQVQKEITTLEYLLLACQQKKLFPSLDQEIKAVKLLSLMNLNPESQLCYLSSGQMQKLQITQAIFKESKVLLLDEPFSNLDLKNQIETICLLKKLTAEGKSLLITTHDLNLALRYANELWIIHNKTIISVQPTDIDKVQQVLGTFFYSYHCLNNDKYVWLNY